MNEHESNLHQLLVRMDQSLCLNCVNSKLSEQFLLSRNSHSNNKLPQF